MPPQEYGKAMIRKAMQAQNPLLAMGRALELDPRNEEAKKAMK